MDDMTCATTLASLSNYARASTRLKGIQSRVKLEKLINSLGIACEQALCLGKKIVHRLFRKELNNLLFINACHNFVTCDTTDYFDNSFFLKFRG